MEHPPDALPCFSFQPWRDKSYHKGHTASINKERKLYIHTKNSGSLCKMEWVDGFLLTSWNIFRIRVNAHHTSFSIQPWHAMDLHKSICVKPAENRCSQKWFRWLGKRLLQWQKLCCTFHFPTWPQSVHHIEKRRLQVTGQMIWCPGRLESHFKN